MYLGIDDIADQIYNSSNTFHTAIVQAYSSSSHTNPSLLHEHVIIRGLSDSGYFLRYDRHVDHNEAVLSATKWYFPTPNKVEYIEAMKNTFALMNMSGGVHSNCLIYTRNVNLPAHYCVFAEYAGLFIQTPLFTKQVFITPVL